MRNKMPKLNFILRLLADGFVSGTVELEAWTITPDSRMIPLPEDQWEPYRQKLLSTRMGYSVGRLGLNGVAKITEPLKQNVLIQVCGAINGGGKWIEIDRYYEAPNVLREFDALTWAVSNLLYSRMVFVKVDRPSTTK